jgi:hypothetical protein
MPAMRSVNKVKAREERATRGRAILGLLELSAVSGHTVFARPSWKVSGKCGRQAQTHQRLRSGGRLSASSGFRGH